MNTGKPRNSYNRLNSKYLFIFNGQKFYNYIGSSKYESSGCDIRLFLVLSIDEGWIFSIIAMCSNKVNTEMDFTPRHVAAFFSKLCHDEFCKDQSEPFISAGFKMS